MKNLKALSFVGLVSLLLLGIGCKKSEPGTPLPSLENKGASKRSEPAPSPSRPTTPPPTPGASASGGSGAGREKTGSTSTPGK